MKKKKFKLNLNKQVISNLNMSNAKGGIVLLSVKEDYCKPNYTLDGFLCPDETIACSDECASAPYQC